MLEKLFDSRWRCNQLRAKCRVSGKAKYARYLLFPHLSLNAHTSYTLQYEQLNNVITMTTVNGNHVSKQNSTKLKYYI